MSIDTTSPAARMTSRVTRLVFSNKAISMLLTLTGAASVVLATILARRSYSPEDLGLFAAVITIIQMVWSFGCMGFNQGILRLIDTRSKRLEIPDDLATISNMGVLLSTLPIAWGMSSYFLPEHFWLLIPLVLSIQLSMMASSYLRAWEYFVASQTIMQLWRYCTLAYVLFSMLPVNATPESQTFTLSIPWLVMFLTLPSLVGSIVLFLLYRQSTTPISERKMSTASFLSLTGGFFGSLFAIALMRNFDRIAAIAYFDLETVGNLFFVASLVCYPFFLIAGQVTFFRMPHYRRHLTKAALLKDLYRCAACSIAGVVLIVLATMASNHFLQTYHPKFVLPINLVLIYGLVGGLSLLYSIYSSAFGAIGSANAIWRANVINLSLVGLYLGLLAILPVNLTVMLITLVMLWISRLVIFHVEVFKAVNSHANHAAINTPIQSI
ncbi:polysaccharide biosynthesis protein [Lacunimicrobium album]